MKDHSQPDFEDKLRKAEKIAREVEGTITPRAHEVEAPASNTQYAPQRPLSVGVIEEKDVHDAFAEFIKAEKLRTLEYQRLVTKRKAMKLNDLKKVR
jgi:hypothetical protein